MSADDKVTDIILQELRDIKAALAVMQANGCSKAESHKSTQEAVVELFGRMREVERVQAEGRGKLVVIVTVLTTAAGLFFEWLGRQFT